MLVDGTHWNDYVNGYYAGNMGNFTEIAAGMNAQVTIQQPDDPMTAEDLNGVALLVISAPLKYTSEYTGDAVVSTFEPEFIDLVANYVNGGGTVIICGLADYQDANQHEEGTYTTYTQVNNLLDGHRLDHARQRRRAHRPEPATADSRTGCTSMTLTLEALMSPYRRRLPALRTAARSTAPTPAAL